MQLIILLFIWHLFRYTHESEVNLFQVLLRFVMQVAPTFKTHNI